jgi:two-component system response regulator AgrA
MRVFILEDINVQRTWLEKQVRDIADKHKISIQIFSTGKPAEIMAELNKPTDYNLYFLDMEIDGAVRAGLETAAKIRENDLHGMIVFNTIHSELAPKTYAYQVAAFDFVVKDDEEAEKIKQIEACLLKAVEYNKRNSMEQDFFTFKDKFSSVKLPFSEILYFERIKDSHKIELHAKNRIMELTASLSEIESNDKRFYRCHNSFVVNLVNVVSLDKKTKTVLLREGGTIEVSRKKMAGLNEALCKKTITMLD